MRLKTKLVVSATALTFAIVLMLSVLFVSELMRQRIEQTAAANDVLAHQVCWRRGRRWRRGCGRIRRWTGATRRCMQR